ncbi:hypothetical protein [Hyphomonas chukchiensis]|uniref:Uncharacterized protein n=1 Tax=Hyphomonas chukchiensis TaxID=1280947 RepID=A0A062ULF4_9PROT|nr:hypothetical protein [Hyphomonas chukchiensis]KCZ59515.1 hypothetical protein HY30_14700 [Hyphomonas chukchiensis]
MSRKLVWMIVIAFAALAAVLWGLTFFWQGMGVEVTGLGWGAYIAGGVFTLALSGGLFLLSFHSARHGYDDIGGSDTPEE